MKHEVNTSQESATFRMSELPINCQGFLRISASSAPKKYIKKEKVVQKCQRQERRSRSTEDITGTF